MDERRDDWRRGVDENLASLNAGQRVWERELAIIRKLLAEADNLLRGDPEKDTDGAIARLHQLENEVNLFKAVLLKDAAGGKGLQGRVEDLETGDKRSERWLKVWIAFIGLVSAALVAAASNLDRIETLLHLQNKDPVDQMIENARHPKTRRRHIVIREQPDTPDAD